MCVVGRDLHDVVTLSELFRLLVEYNSVLVKCFSLSYDWSFILVEECIRAVKCLISTSLRC
jgi:hypothetical protein